MSDVETHPPIEAFLFDMGDVLIKFCHARMFRQLGEVLGRDADEAKRAFVESGTFVGYDRGDLSDDEVFSRIQAQSARKLDRGAVWNALSDIFEPNPGMFELLTDLKARGFRMVLLSNTCRPHIEFVRARFPILGLLDDCVLSFEVGAVKPDPAIFRAALARISVPPERCFYTDDIPDYIEVGRAHGLQAEVFTGVGELRRQLAARNIHV